ncbi:MAG: YdjY domain-containing protein [Phycisphaerales bacterium]
MWSGEQVMRASNCTSSVERKQRPPTLTVGLLMAAATVALALNGGCQSSEHTTHTASPAAREAPGEPADRTSTRKAAGTVGDSIATSDKPNKQPSETAEPVPPPATNPARAPSEPSPTAPPALSSTLREVFPGVRVDLAGKLVEFDGMVPIDVHNPKSPRVYLEVIACTYDSKEHESLVVTSAKPSQVHAALLMIGLEPGAPGSWRVDEQSRVTSVPPRGSPVRVTLVFNPASPDAKEIDPAELVVNARSKSRASSLAGAGFVFGGSRIVEWQGRSFYDADGTGTLIGLATFGSETIAWREVFSPEAAIAEPVWIADNERVPAANTPVTVRLRPVSEK